MKEKLMKQKVQCERVLREKRKGSLDFASKPIRESKLKEKSLLKEEISLLESIIEEKANIKKNE